MEDYAKAKVYYDGSHYIAIPRVRQPWKKRKIDKLKTKQENPHENQTTKDIFEEAYRENVTKKKDEKVKEIKDKLKETINNEQELDEYVEKNLERKNRNAIVRKTRLMRKVYLHEWNYFCTFTYDEEKWNETEFRAKLSDCLKKMCYRKGWKYIGVWERSPIKNRLHFHGIFYIPNMVGELEEIEDYNTTAHRMQKTMQNTYFCERFGRNDFKMIENDQFLAKSAAYLLKYIEKSGEKLVYSKGIPTYFISDILPDDVICTIGREDRKLLLFDDFYCLDEGVLIGKVNKETIKQMPKSN